VETLPVPSNDRFRFDDHQRGFQSVHTNRSQTQKIRSVGLSFSRLGAECRETVSCCHKAMFSSRSCAELLNIEARGADSGEQGLRSRPEEQTEIDQLQ
jgi:uncharacterized UPF0160 family protein